MQKSITKHNIIFLGKGACGLPSAVQRCWPCVWRVVNRCGAEKALERVELPDNRFHDLRHSFAVNSLQAGDNIKNAQANLGHATSAFTMDVYCHVSQSMARESAARTQAFYESVKPV